MGCTINLELGRYLRKGEDRELASLQRKAMATYRDPDGGFFLTEQMAADIERTATSMAALSGLAQILAGHAAVYKKPVRTTGVSYAWRGEGEAPSSTSTPTFSLLTFEAREVDAFPEVTNESLEDLGFDAEVFLIDEVALAFADAAGQNTCKQLSWGRPKSIVRRQFVGCAQKNPTSPCAGENLGQELASRSRRCLRTVIRRGNHTQAPALRGVEAGRSQVGDEPFGLAHHDGKEPVGVSGQGAAGHPCPGPQRSHQVPPLFRPRRASKRVSRRLSSRSIGGAGRRRIAVRRSRSPKLRAEQLMRWSWSMQQQAKGVLEGREHEPLANRNLDISILSLRGGIER